MGSVARPGIECAAVDEIDVHEPVAIEVPHCHTGSGDLDDIGLFCRTRDVTERAHTSRGGHVDEGDARRGVGRCRRHDASGRRALLCQRRCSKARGQGGGHDGQDPSRCGCRTAASLFPRSAGQMVEEFRALVFREVEDEFCKVGGVKAGYERDKFRPLARFSKLTCIIEDFAGSDVFRHCTALRW